MRVIYASFKAKILEIANWPSVHLLSRPIKVERTGTHSDGEPKRKKPLSSLREFHWYTDMIFIVGNTCYRTLTLTSKNIGHKR